MIRAIPAAFAAAWFLVASCQAQPQVRNLLNTPAPRTACSDVLVQQALAAVNKARSEAGVPEVACSDAVGAAAGATSQALCSEDNFSPGTGDCSTSGLSTCAVETTVGFGPESSLRTLETEMLLEASATTAGFGIAECPVSRWTAFVGTPAGAAPPPTPSPVRPSAPAPTAAALEPAATPAPPTGAAPPPPPTPSPVPPSAPAPTAAALEPAATPAPPTGAAPPPPPDAALSPGDRMFSPEDYEVEEIPRGAPTPPAPPPPPTPPSDNKNDTKTITGGAVGMCEDPGAQQMLKLINERRVESSLNPVQCVDVASQVAGQWSQQLCENGVVFNDDANCPKSNFSVCVEAMGWTEDTTPESMMDLWKSSVPDNRAIMSGIYTQVGIGHATCDVSPNMHWVAIMGAP